MGDQSQLTLSVGLVVPLRHLGDLNIFHPELGYILYPLNI